MTRVTCPDDMSPAFVDDSGDRADQARDALDDLKPVPRFQHVPVSRAQLLAACDVIDCGQQLPTRGDHS